MDHFESAAEVHAPHTPPHAGSSRRQYLDRLGIQNSPVKVPSFIKVPTTHHEAPGQFEAKGRNAKAFDYSQFADDAPQTKVLLGREGRTQEVSGEPIAAGPSEAIAARPSEANKPIDESGDLNMEYTNLTNQADFRVSFLRKLSYEKVWVPQSQRAPKHQTVTIFDWDDTLLCTSYLNRMGEGKPLHPTIARHLRDIEVVAKKLLEKAVRLGHTFLITNAMSGWVEYSCAKWLPGLLPVLRKVRVISARSKWEAAFPDEVRQWKIHAFLEVQRQLDSVITNLTSLGDAEYEMEATRLMGQQFEQASVKTIKFRNNPTPEELLKQLQLVEHKFESIVENARNLRVSLERKKTEPAS